MECIVAGFTEGQNRKEHLVLCKLALSVQQGWISLFGQGSCRY